ncbi:hypothetical protein acsn021_19610 [Anaerocolumna cellulosilytica]|uniref:Uncharacterized protein n=1 Tax=Anaerocolumna cellulosilytica TaxID=433286 RepID=A0A6S6R4J3_9FIRM|nr:hypothetical protein [Anaerocolumna cellulosilytica]MBB5196485.1 hypothetical protein [Anaerocolumna cellulosilytica]BCJ94392.1 hypothetical protein acsn021_19610 [Anaerocolumna cellulosilytica]
MAVPSVVKGASNLPKETKQVRVYGNIFYNINENGSNTSKIVRKQLNEYPFTLYYSNTVGETKSFELKTDGNGDYSFGLKILSIHSKSSTNLKIKIISFIIRKP